MKCPKCKAEMEEGQIMAGGATYFKWLSNKAKGILSFIKNGKSIVTYKCTKCGYLESYAE